MTDRRDYVYDVETFCNVFVAIFTHVETRQRFIFEISERRNQATELYWFLRSLEEHKLRLFGFNNVGFDWPILRFLMDTVETRGTVTAWEIYQKAQEIFSAQDGNRFGLVDWSPRVTQGDLYKIHHFDNKAKMTSLKALEFAMRSHTIIDLPFSPHHPLTVDQIDTLITYCAHDVNETIRFYLYSWEKIEFRQSLETQFGKSLLNHNDTKIGKDYFIMELERAMPGACYDERKKPRQTHRRSIPLANVIFPYIGFEHPEFCRVLDYLKTCDITDTKSAPQLKDLHAVVDGFRFDFGTGGIHGSLSATRVTATDDVEIIDVDVKSYYPNLAIKNRVFPHHLSEKFCDIYQDLYERRGSYAKGTPGNEMLKLALNGVYGDSNNVYGPFLDPAYTMAITVNGQLLLCMLAEPLLKHAGISIIQANTDGITLQVHRDAKPYFEAVCKWWQDFTKLELEFANYRAMFIRDVNNYLAVSTKGKVKRIGAYAFETAAENPATREVQWHKDPSALVIQKAAQAVMVDGADLRSFIWSHSDPWDFMMRAKAPRTSRLVTFDGQSDTVQQNTLRYQIATDGPALVKIMPELASKPGTGERRIGINVGWKVRLCNDVGEWSWSTLEREFYFREAEKLVIR